MLTGAEPGDTLVVTFNKIETNRVSAWSGSLLSPYATTPMAITTRTDREAKRLQWTIDKAKGVARLDDATVTPAASSCRCGRCSDAWAWRRVAKKPSPPARLAHGAATWITRG
jgi:hypothetical protein